MRDRNLLHLFLGLNVALAVAFAAYLFLSSNSQPKVVATNFPGKTNQPSKTPATNLAKVAPAKTNAADRGRPLVLRSRRWSSGWRGRIRPGGTGGSRVS